MADLFRKSSIEKLSNPEQLDKAITISSPLSWVALLGFFVIIVTVVCWSIFGTMTETQTITGIITNKSGVSAIYTDKTGTVSDISIEVGESVYKGDKIADAFTSDGEKFSIFSNVNGLISELLIKKDDKIFPGNEIARITPDVDDNVLVCYVPLSISKEFEEDMDVNIYPLSVDSQKYGHMEAKIIDVGNYPVSAENMQFVLGNGNMLADQFLSEGSVVSVICKLKESNTSVNGYYWTNKAGESMEISNGMLVSAKVVTKEYSPIKKLFNKFSD